jgi:cell division protein FtsW (lipid II flippase)
MQAPDGWLLAIVLTLVVFGTVMIFSASFPQTADLAGSARYEPLIRQIMYMLIGLAGMFVAMQIDYHRYARWAFPAMLAIMLLLLGADRRARTRDDDVRREELDLHRLDLVPTQRAGQAGADYVHGDLADR